MPVHACLAYLKQTALYQNQEDQSDKNWREKKHRITSDYQSEIQFMRMQNVHILNKYFLHPFLFDLWELKC